MAKTFFGYTVEEDEGSLVIRIGGALAEQVLEQLRQGLETGRGLAPLSLLSPLVAVGRMLSAQPPSVAKTEEGRPPSAEEVDQLLSQELDQTLAAFRQQMQEFRSSVEEVRGQRVKPGGPSETPASAD
jgi:hypothetical protein